MNEHIFDSATEYTTEQIASIAKKHCSSSEIISPLLATSIGNITYVFDMAGGDVIWRYSHAWGSTTLDKNPIPDIGFNTENVPDAE